MNQDNEHLDMDRLVLILLNNQPKHFDVEEFETIDSLTDEIRIRCFGFDFDFDSDEDFVFQKDHLMKYRYRLFSNRSNNLEAIIEISQNEIRLELEEKKIK